MNAGERAEMNRLFLAWGTAPRLVMGQRLEEDLRVNVAEHLAADQRWRASDRAVAITLNCWSLSYTGIVSKFVKKETADCKSAVGRPEIPVV